MALIIGADQSGNANFWTTNNISTTPGVTYDSMVDVPGIASVSNQLDVGGVQRGNYCTWNPVFFGAAVTYSDANLTAFSSTNGVKNTYGSIAVDTGKWYFEETIAAQSDAYRAYLGFAQPLNVPDGFYLNDVPGFSATWNVANNTVTYGTQTKVAASGTGSWETSTAVSDTKSIGDVYMFAYDGTSGKIWFGKNNTWFGSGSPSTGANPAGILSTQFSYTPACNLNVTGAGNSVTLNCGQRAFAYTPPAGFKSICTTNLPNPVIKRPRDHFDVKTWTGTGKAVTVGTVTKQTPSIQTKGLRFRRVTSTSGSTLTKSYSSAPTSRTTYTISAWVKPISTGTNAIAVWGTGGNWESLRWHSDGTIYWCPGSGKTWTTNVRYTPNQWYHVMVAVDTTQSASSNRGKLYINGALVTNYSSQDTVTLNAQTVEWGVPSAAGSGIGFTGGDGTANAFDGYISEFNYIDGQAKSPTDFGQYDANNNWVPQRYTGTYGTNGSYLPFNAPSLGASTYGGVFTGSNHLSLPSNAAFAFGTGDYTVEAWVNSSSTAQQVIFATGQTGTNNWYLSFDPDSYLGVGNQSVFVLQGTVQSESNTWYHVAASRSSGTLRLFVNGNQVASGADSTTWIQGGNPSIGSNAQSSQYFSGLISNLRVSKGTALYTSNFTPSITALTTTSQGATAGNISLLTLQNDTLVDNSSNNFTVTGTAQNATVYPFAVSPTYSVYLDGTGDYITTPASSAFNFGTDNFTMECWFNSATTSKEQTLIGMWASDGSGVGMSINGGASASNNLRILWGPSGSWSLNTSSNNIYTLNSWNHAALVRSGSNLYGYLNGVQVCSLSSISGSAYYNASIPFSITRAWSAAGAAYDFQGYISNVRVTKGVAVYTGAFTSPAAPLPATQSSGTNIAAITAGQCSLLTVQSAALLDNSGNSNVLTRNGNTYITDFAIPPVNSGVGKDNSGNNNHWGTRNIDQTTGLSTYDAVYDSPTDYVDSSGNIIGDYAVMVANSNYTLTNGGLSIYRPGATQSYVLGDMPISYGKFYWEVTVTTLASNYPRIGIAGSDPEQLSNYPGGNSGTSARVWAGAGGSNLAGISPTTTGALFGTGGSNSTNVTFTGFYSQGDVVMFALDKDNNKLWVGKNGTWYTDTSTTTTSAAIANNTAAAAFNDLGMINEVYPAIFCNQTSDRFTMNFGQTPFAYTPPTGFKTINSKNVKDFGSYNLPDSFGNFVNTPDLVWIKSRSTTGTHVLTDTVRGPNNNLFSNLTTANTVAYNKITGFQPNGFTLGADDGTGTGDVNYAGTTYAGWAWNRGKTPGFDIVSYGGTGAVQNVPHNLGQQPGFMMIKAIGGASAQHWRIWHKGITTANYFLSLPDLGYGTADANIFPNPPSNSTFTVGSGNSAGGSSYSYIAYLWAEVPGFSKIGTYTGNSSANGPFVYCGFKPRFILARQLTTGYGWIIIDTERSKNNPASVWVNPDATTAEGSPAAEFYDILSNGFKLRYSGAFNTSGASHAYVAFAENPFKYATAR